jgi:hypothetical protein
MSAQLAWLAALLATDAPALPGAGWMRMFLDTSWLLVTWSALFWLARKPPQRGWLFAGLVAGAGVLLLAYLKAPFWLGLAFQSPSFSSLFLIALAATSGGFNAGAAPPKPVGRARRCWVLLAAVLPGYLLLLDTFAVLPWQIYAWGFSPLVLVCLLALSLLPAVLRGFTLFRSTPEVWVAPSALLLFAATRLPSGNVWDALIDPWLWLYLNGALLRCVYCRWRHPRPTAPQI